MTVEATIALLTLTSMEIVLGIDNIIFISILSAKLPQGQQVKARRWGLFLALILRLGLLLSLNWLMSLTEPLVSLFDHSFSGRDIILIFGGFFLIAKSTLEVHEKLESPKESTHAASAKTHSFKSVLLQILVLDIVFSLDSVITAVGMAQQVPIMVAAMVLSVIVMLLASEWINNFVHRHPSVKMLALSFLILIGTTLVFEGMGGHVAKGYIYFAMAFSLGVEILNINYRKRQTAKQ